MRTVVLILGVVCIGAALPSVGFPQEPSEAAGGREQGAIRCEQMVFCAGVKDRAPVGVSDNFPSDIFSVYCFTSIVGAEDTTLIMHNWYRDDTGMASVELTVKAARWRTWSSKRMVSDWQGQWRVDVTTADGAVIESGKFTLE